jgi:hypothetical protein
MQMYGLEILNSGYYTDYSMSVDPSTFNEYAAAVGQFFFAQIPDQIKYKAKDIDGADIEVVSFDILKIFYYKTTTYLQATLSDTFMNPSSLYVQGRFEGLLRYRMKYLCILQNK